MELYFLRHAIAVPRGSGADDSQRPLTADGRIKMLEIAQGMKSLELSFETLLSSPYVRARQTAEIVAKVFNIKKTKIIYTRTLVPGDPSFADLVQTINARARKSSKLLLVGHEPHLSQFISFLLASRQQIAIELKKGGLCFLTAPRISGSGGGATLHWLLTPSQLRRTR